MGFRRPEVRFLSLRPVYRPFQSERALLSAVALRDVRAMHTASANEDLWPHTPGKWFCTRNKHLLPTVSKTRSGGSQMCVCGSVAGGHDAQSSIESLYAGGCATPSIAWHLLYWITPSRSASIMRSLTVSIL